MLVCHTEENVWLAFESVYKLAESDRDFAKLIAKKSKRVLAVQTKVALAADSNGTPRPTPRTVDKLCRRIWEFTEEVRLTAAAEACALIVAGVMSGTSADGIDVALVRIKGRGVRSRIELLAHHQVAYASKVRRAILDSMNAVASVADLSRLNFLLGELYADAVETAQRRSGLQCELVGCHGQTIYHQGDAGSVHGPEDCLYLADRRRRGDRRQAGSAGSLRLPPR